MTPAIRKVDHVLGETLVFRDAKIADAEFILSLRIDSKKGRYLSHTPADVDTQRRWLADYERELGQAYFIIEHGKRPIGTVRMYDAVAESFCWGSWILAEESPRQAAIESALMVYSYAIDWLGFSAAHFTVNNENRSVWQFHERFGAQRVRESDCEYFYRLDLAAIQQSCTRYARFLPHGVTGIPARAP